MVMSKAARLRRQQTRTCVSKIAHGNEYEAWGAATRHEDCWRCDSRWEFRAYRCDVGDPPHWHVGHSVRQSERSA